VNRCHGNVRGMVGHARSTDAAGRGDAPVPAPARVAPPVVIVIVVIVIGGLKV
jgi:hypothetical protein